MSPINHQGKQKSSLKNSVNCTYKDSTDISIFYTFLSTEVSSKD